MIQTDLLDMLKVGLGLTTDRYDQRLLWTLDSAEEQIKREGAVLDPDSYDDALTIVMYADWLWRKRESGEGMPRMLRYRLNNKVLQGKAR